MKVEIIPTFVAAFDTVEFSREFARLFRDIETIVGKDRDIREIGVAK